MVMMRLKVKKSLITTRKPNLFDHKGCKGRRILKFEFVFTIMNGDSDARSSMSFYFPTRMDNSLDMNQTKYLTRLIIMIITIIRIENKTREWTPSLIINSLTYVRVSGGKNLLVFHKTLMMTWAFEECCLEINVIVIQ